MKTKVTYSRFTNFIGMTNNGKIQIVRDVICFRKPMRSEFAKKIIGRYKYVVGIISAHNLHRAPNSKYCQLWCHCFRNPDLYIKNKPALLLSESDFVDPSFIPVLKRNVKYDFYYYTSGGRNGIVYKGMDIFIKSLPVLCGKYGLKGIVIKYQKDSRSFQREHHRALKKYRKHIRIKIGKQSPQGVAKIMSRCRFGFFPNLVDCSPLLLTESLVRNCPVLVNRDILGGWKYVNQNTGRLFGLNDLDIQLSDLLSSNFSPCDDFMQNYGYINSAKRLAEEGAKIIKPFSNFKLVALYGTAKKMGLIKNA